MESLQKVDLYQKVKEMIVERLGLDISPEEIITDAPIFKIDDEGRGLALDSIDALELAVGLNEAFGLKHQSDDLSILYSVETIVEYIKKKKGE